MLQPSKIRHLIKITKTKSVFNAFLDISYWRLITIGYYQIVENLDLHIVSIPQNTTVRLLWCSLLLFY